jgi:hypothetical protein
MDLGEADLSFDEEDLQLSESDSEEEGVSGREKGK